MSESGKLRGVTERRCAIGLFIGLVALWVLLLCLESQAVISYETFRTGTVALLIIGFVLMSAGYIWWHVFVYPRKEKRDAVRQRSFTHETDETARLIYGEDS